MIDRGGILVRNINVRVELEELQNPDTRMVQMLDITTDHLTPDEGCHRVCEVCILKRRDVNSNDEVKAELDKLLRIGFQVDEQNLNYSVIRLVRDIQYHLDDDSKRIIKDFTKPLEERIEQLEENLLITSKVLKDFNSLGFWSKLKVLLMGSGLEEIDYD